MDELFQRPIEEVIAAARAKWAASQEAAAAAKLAEAERREGERLAGWDEFEDQAALAVPELAPYLVGLGRDDPSETAPALEPGARRYTTIGALLPGCLPIVISLLGENGAWTIDPATGTFEYKYRVPSFSPGDRNFGWGGEHKPYVNWANPFSTNDLLDAIAVAAERGAKFAAATAEYEAALEEFNQLIAAAEAAAETAAEPETTDEQDLARALKTIIRGIVLKVWESEA